MQVSAYYQIKKNLNLMEIIVIVVNNNIIVMYGERSTRDDEQTKIIYCVYIYILFHFSLQVLGIRYISNIYYTLYRYRFSLVV